MPANPNKILQRALGYPYPRPNHSFLFSDGKFESFPSGSTDFSALTPVIACGSNAAPEQLARKFAHIPASQIPVTKIHLRDFVCSFSAHLTAYGSVPATLSYSPGQQITGHITWLTGSQLERMHATEALGVNYRFSRLDNVLCECEGYGPLNTIYAYISKHGHFGPHNEPILIREFSNSNAPFRSATQREVQNQIIELFNEEISLDEFILSNIKDKDLRKHHIQKLSRFSSPFHYPLETILEGDSV